MQLQSTHKLVLLTRADASPADVIDVLDIASESWTRLRVGGSVPIHIVDRLACFISGCICSRQYNCIYFRYFLTLHRAPHSATLTLLPLSATADSFSSAVRALTAGCCLTLGCCPMSRQPVWRRHQPAAGGSPGFLCPFCTACLLSSAGARQL